MVASSMTLVAVCSSFFFFHYLTSAPEMHGCYGCAFVQCEMIDNVVVCGVPSVSLEKPAVDEDTLTHCCRDDE